MHGKQLRDFLETKRISPTEAARILDKKSSANIYAMFSTRKFSAKTLRNLEEKLGFTPGGYSYSTIQSDMVAEPQMSEIRKPTKVKAGYTNNNNPGLLNSFISKVMPDLSSGIYDIFEVEGNSMVPTLFHGDDVICKLVTDIQQVKNGQVHVVITDTSQVIKRITLRPRYIFLNSDNRTDLKEFTSYTLPIDSIREIWHVKRKISGQLPEPSDLYDKITELEADIALIKKDLEEIQKIGL